MIELNDIADLISSLGKAEKRFFKMTATTEPGDVTSLVALFDEVEKDSGNLTRLQKDNFYTANHYNDLYLLILRSLRGYYAESNDDYRIKDETINLRCLIDKAQYKQCRKMLIVLKRELYEREEFNCLLKLLDIEKKLIAFEDGKDLKQKPELIANEEQLVINKELRLVSYYRMYLKARAIHAADETQLESMLSEPMLSDYYDALSLKERVFVLLTKQLLFKKLNRINEADKTEQLKQELLAKHDFLKEYHNNILV